MQAGIDAARGDVIVTMDGDLQNDPGDIPALVGRSSCEDDQGPRRRLAARAAGRVPPAPQIPSMLANRLIRRVTGLAVPRPGLQPQGVPGLRAARGAALRRDAPLHPGLARDGHLAGADGRGAGPRTAAASTAARSTASRGPSACSWTSSRSSSSSSSARGPGTSSAGSASGCWAPGSESSAYLLVAQDRRGEHRGPAAAVARLLLRHGRGPAPHHRRARRDASSASTSTARLAQAYHATERPPLPPEVGWHQA